MAGDPGWLQATPRNAGRRSPFPARLSFTQTQMTLMGGIMGWQGLVIATWRLEWVDACETHTRRTYRRASSQDEASAAAEMMATRESYDATPESNHVQNAGFSLRVQDEAHGSHC
ncbi:uncharacterized protein ColSpa_01120 [Colletotrichum spaethianum]|uniref:Uncharacterized protein n=1 Tax=Colletotrichum spaethianum TaxID=700344 RepID=A0AA37P6X5_9PEZI|nr:uncharacterized protein ColSpa_01120 [Colletotrichum spaethianum]GKT40939.1 hypothetical protein ColSpa_01120 [Colletotrichum spaethianum]